MTGGLDMSLLQYNVKLEYARLNSRNTQTEEQDTNEKAKFSWH